MTDQPEEKEQSGSPPFVTGGGGFEYEDGVAAYILAAMLAEQPPFGKETKNVAKLDWQTGTSGWRLDDLLVTCDGATSRHIAISCKAGRHVTAGGWPDDTRTRIWEHWLRTDNNPYQKSTDLLAVVAGAISLDAKEAWDRLLSEALVGDPKRFMTQYQTADASSAAGRDLVESLKCPDSLVSQVSDEPAQRFDVIRHVRLWRLDVLATDSSAVTQAIEWCRSVLVSGDLTEGEKLFELLVSIASERRPRGGSVSRRELIELVAAQFALKAAPSHEASWRKLDAHSKELRQDVRSTINDRICFAHNEAWADIQKVAGAGRVIMLNGESGSGKSALAARLAQNRRRVLWLAASDLEHSTVTAVGDQLGVTVALGALIDEERSIDGLLVIDGAERLTETGRRTAARLVTAAAQAAKPWLVAITSQADGAEVILHEIGKQAQNIAPVQSVEIQLPDEDTVKGVLGAVGVTLSASATPSVVRVLRNLKALDWVARALSQKELKSFPDLVDQVWKGLVGTENARARGEVLKKLGKEDAALVVGGVPSSKLSAGGEQQVAETLIRDGLLSNRRERYFFRHDLLGDWARLLSLIESGEGAAQAVKEVSGSLRWSPAIRLFAQWLLQEGEVERQRLLTMIVSEPSHPSSIALLEGLFRSPDCGVALAAILDDPAFAGEAAVKGLLNVFETVATRPSDICDLVPKTHAESASIREALRVPVHELWPSVMEVMEKRAERIAQLAPLRLGAVMRRWLSDLPTATRRDLASMHRACATLAVAAARELQARIAESIYSETKGVELVFEAALYAAPWLPDEVASLALELSARRPMPPTVQARVEAQQKQAAEAFKARLAKLTPEERTRRQGSFSLGSSHYQHRQAFPDGPAERINEGFRTAVFAAGVLVRLTAVRPAIAQEVLLACCLEDPSDEDPLYASYYLGDLAGTVDPMGWYPPLYLRGPWLVLLRQAPEQGLDAVMRLVAVSTSEWLRLRTPPPDHAAYESEARYSTVTLQIEGKSRTFRGDHDVFGWYRGYGRGGNIVASALMALEFWLYELLDAKKPVEWVVKRMLEAGSSVALLGVLGALARKDARLLRGPLRPLIQSWMVLDWDEHMTQQAQMPPFDPLGLKALNTFYDNAADRWSALPHRRFSLPWLIAQELAFRQAEIMQECASARAAWQAEIDGGSCLSPETAERLIALLDPANLSLEERPGNQWLLSVQWPPSLQAKYDERGKTATAGLAANQLRQLMRRLLDDPRALSDEQAEAIWKEISSLPAADSDGENSEVNIGAGAAVAAVLENHASGWLDRHPQRRSWCEGAAVKAIGRESKLDSLASGSSMFTEFSAAFAGAWGVARLAAGDNRELVRRVVGEAMTAPEHIVTGQVLAAATRVAARMPAEYERLFNLMWLWAALRNLPSGTWEPESWEAKVATARRQSLVNAYVNERIPTLTISWEELKVRAARATDRHERRRREREPKVSFLRESSAPVAPLPLPATWDEFGTHGFNWGLLDKVVEKLPYVVRPSLGGNLAPLVELDRRLLELALWTMRRAPQRQRSSSPESLPEMLDRQTLSRAASIIAKHEDDDVAMSIWKALAPQLVLHHRWAEAFFDSWFASSREKPEEAKQFHKRWLRMIEYAEGLSEWKSPETKKSYELQKVKAAILGVNERANKIGVEEDRPFLATMVDRYRAWAQEYAADSWRLRSFCYFLLKPGAIDLRIPALVWVRDALKLLTEHRSSDKDLTTQIVALCAAVWYAQAELLLANAEARSALIEIVQHLARWHVQEANELKADIETAIARNPLEKPKPATSGSEKPPTS